MGRRLRDQTIREGINTDGARSFARDTYNSPKDVKLNWWEFFSNYRTKKWKQELKTLQDSTGITFETVCEYMGIEYSGLPGFYRKVPKTKETFIGIGMAYKVPLKTINRWLLKYGGKKKLYIKDALSDLIWIHLIDSNYKDTSGEINYFKKFDECRDSVAEIYNKMNKEITDEHVDTHDLDESVQDIVYDSEYKNLRSFVRENSGAFESAYGKPKAFLRAFVDNILRVKNGSRQGGRSWTLNTLRGYLDDSMINYITSGIKYVPKNKRTHISMGLALGMTIDDLDRYLHLLGYASLDGTNLEEGLLINFLEKWEEEHPLQRYFKEKYLYDGENIEISESDECQAVNDMLRLRGEIKEMYESFLENSPNSGHIRKFPYMND